jgi:hypothetical protein
MVVAGLVLIVSSLIWFALASGPAGAPAQTEQPTNPAPAAMSTRPPAGAPAGAPAAAAQPAVTQLIPYPDIARVSVGDAKAAFDLGNAVFVDTRGDLYFAEGHLPGAISMTEQDIPARLDQLEPSDWIITYCT